MSKYIKKNNLTFEVWKNSIRLIEPRISPCIRSFSDLTKPENVENIINDFFQIMDLGVEIYNSFKFSK